MGDSWLDGLDGVKEIQTAEEDGDVTMPRRPRVIFEGATVEDDPTNNRTRVIVGDGSGGGGGGGGSGVALSNDVPPVLTPSVGTGGTGDHASRSDHRHQVTVAAPVPIGPSLSAGSANALARADHVHTTTLAGDITGPSGTTNVAKIQGKAVTIGTPSNGQVLTYDGTQLVMADPPAGGGGGGSGPTLSDSTPTANTAATGAPGAAGAASRSDHRHQVTTGTPRAIGTLNAPGTANELVRADHEHELTAAPLALVTQAHTVMEPYGLASHWNAIPHYPKWREIGVEWLRLDFHWYEIEAVQGTYDWSKFDAAVTAAKSLGMKVLAVFGKVPGWANGSQGENYAPLESFDGAWSNYVNLTATRYANSVDAWEIWNEPNHDDFLLINGATWAENHYALETAENKKRIEYMHLIDLAMVQGDLKHKLVTTSGFASGGDWDDGFIPYLATQGNWLTQFRVANTHAYGYERENQYEVLRTQILQMEDIGDAQGKSDWPIWVTEHGIVLPPGSGSDYDDARYMIRSYAEALRLRNCKKLFWFPSQWLSDHHALLTSSDTPTALYNAYRTLTQFWRNPVQVDFWDDTGVTDASGAIATLVDGSRVGIIWSDGANPNISDTSLKVYYAFDQFGAPVDPTTTQLYGAPYFVILSKGWGELATVPYSLSTADVGDVPTIITVDGQKRWGWAAPAAGGSLAGDVTGALGANTVSKLQGKALIVGTPADGQVITYEASTSTFKLKAPPTGGGGSGPAPGGAPVNVTKAAANAGAAATYSRSDHKHDITTAAPSSIVGQTNVEGTSQALARADHQHALTLAGDVSGPPSLTTVYGITNRPISGQPGAAETGAVLMYRHADLQLSWQKLGGDLVADPGVAGGGLAFNLLQRIQGKAITVGSPSDGQVLTWETSSSSMKFKDPPAGGGGGGTTPDTWYINVLDRGVVRGTLADNTARSANRTAFNAAIAACASENKILVVPPGIYQIYGGALLITNSGFRWLGTVASTIVQYQNNCPVIHIGPALGTAVVSCENVIIDGATLKYSGTGASGANALELTGVWMSSFDHIDIGDPNANYAGRVSVPYRGIYMDGASGTVPCFSNTWRNIRVKHFVYRGIDSPRPGFDAATTGTRWENIYVSGGDSDGVQNTTDCAVFFQMHKQLVLTTFNVEWMRVEGAAVAFDSCGQVEVLGFNLEGVRLHNASSADAGFFYLASSVAKFQGLTAYNNQVLSSNNVANGSLFWLADDTWIELGDISIELTSRVTSGFFLVNGAAVEATTGVRVTLTGDVCLNNNHQVQRFGNLPGGVWYLGAGWENNQLQAVTNASQFIYAYGGYGCQQMIVSGGTKTLTYGFFCTATISTVIPPGVRRTVRRHPSSTSDLVVADSNGTIATLTASDPSAEIVFSGSSWQRVA